MRQSRAMHRVRRGVDGAMIFASLLMLAWPALSAGRTGDVVDLAVPIGVVIFLGTGVLYLAGRWSLVLYAPATAALIMAIFAVYRHGDVSPGQTRLLLTVCTII